jgi:hypothetical protein
MKNWILALAVGTLGMASIAQADLDIGPGILNFGIVSMNNPTTQEQYIQLTNTDPVNPVLGISVLTGLCQPEFLFSTTCSTDMPPSSSCLIMVDFHPTMPMSYECQITFTAQSETGQAAVTLMGSAQRF